MKNIIISILFLLALILANPVYAQWAGVLTGSPPGSVTPPSYSTELVRVDDSTNGISATSTTACVVTADVNVGDTIVLICQWYLGSGMTVSGVADTHSNTYAVRTSNPYATSTSYKTCFVSAKATTKISNGDTVTVTWASPAVAYRWVEVLKIATTTSATPDATAEATGITTTTVSNPITTVAANTVCVGTVYLQSQTATYGSSAWTIIGAAFDPGAGGASTCRVYYAYKNVTGAGAQDIGGTLSGAETFGMVGASFK